MSILQYIEHRVIDKDLSLSLSEKYEPRSLKDLVGREKEVDELRKWLSSRERTHRFAIISGVSGTGKTLLARLLLKEHGYSVMDVNPSVNKSKKDIVDVLSMCNTHKYAVLMDEYDFIDNLSIHDTRFLLDSFPNIVFVFIVSKHTHGKTFDLSKDGLLIHMHALGGSTLIPWVEQIMKKEGMDSSYASKVVSACEHDMRYTLKWLEFNHKTQLSDAAFEASSHAKDEDLDCMTATKMLLYSSEPLVVSDALRIVHYDVNLISSMVSENVMSLLGDEDVRVMESCADLISSADVIESFVYNKQAWDMWEIFALNGAVYPSLLARRDSTEEPNFTKMWSKISNMYYRIYQLDDVRMCLRKKGMSFDLDSLMFLGAKCYHEIVHGDMTTCIKDMVDMGMTSDNINMTVKYGSMMRYKNTLQKKIKKEYDKAIGKVVKRAPRTKEKTGGAT